MNPTLRSTALNTVVVIPLLSNDESYSKKSVQTLFNSLADINLERHTISPKATKSNAKEVTLVIPNANLTPPGEWRYDDTPLKSHDWSLGCQCLFFVDGKRSIHALDRLKAFSSKDQTRSSQYGEFVDLYPSRGIASIIGVLNAKDCKSMEDLHRAEEELESWMHKFTPILYAQKYWEEAFDSPMAPKHYVDKRLFVFDSFDEGNQIDLTKSNLKPGELVAFPPTENMDLHLNVVVNDLAVSMFMNLERRIRILDDLGIQAKESGKAKMEKQPSTSKIGDIADIVGPDSNLNDLSLDEDDMELVVGTGPGAGAGESTSESASKSDKGGGNMGLPGLGRLAANAVKALQKGNILIDDACANLPPIEHELQTPIDFNFDETKLTKRDIEALFKRNAARREKHAADFALQAGSAMDAYARYTKAAEASKAAHDPLWYAAALEGIATTFVAMSDTGGHGADMYLENNFQYPDKVMMAALTILGSADEGKDSTKVDKSKTTMPRAVYALLEETEGIYSRNIKLASIHSELVLKTAWYTSELEGLHVRCRWGEGFTGISSEEETEDHAMIASISGTQKRWELTSVFKIDLSLLQKRGKLDAPISQYTASQCQRFTELLHRAAANGGLDAYTRASVAARCAKLCLKGIRPPDWGEFQGRNKSYRQTFPRKAGFFTAIAAESISQCKSSDAQICAKGFWAAASHLYSKDGNTFEGNNMYAWAALRSTILHAMSIYGGMASSEKALEKLLLLLGECTPKSQHYTRSSHEVIAGAESTEKAKTESNTHLGALNSPTSTFVTPTKPTGHTRRKSASSGIRSSFFPQTTSQAMAGQSKWVDEDPVSMILLPLTAPSSKVAVLRADSGEIQFLKKFVKPYNLLSSLISLHCVITQMNFEACIAAQKRCITSLTDLRRRLPTVSPDNNVESGIITMDKSLLEHLHRSTVSPLEIVSARIRKSESHLLLDKLKAAGFQGKVKGSLSTFFNPYANKKKDSTGKNILTLVAQGEERTIEIEFSNCLAVPLEVPNCQLVFDRSSTVDVEAPPLSFSLPPRTEKYAVHFPFIVGTLNKESIVKEASSNNKEEIKDDAPSLFTFEAIGVRVSTFNRSFFIPFNPDVILDSESSKSKHTMQIPNPISSFVSHKKKSKTGVEKYGCVNLEAVPAQPNLLVSFATSPTPLEDAVAVPVHLSDGEIFTIPPFRLENDFGSSGLGSLDRLQIVGVGMPGLPEEILFDTDEVAKALEEEEDRFSDEESDNDDFDEMMENDGLPPLKMKCLAEGLSLSSINDKSKSLGEGSILSFQIAATHDMGNKIRNGGNVRIRFRYRGPSPITGIEIWRKREIALKIVKMKGPRISSLAFRSDLSWGSPYSDLCHALANQVTNSSPTIDVSDGDTFMEGTVSEIVIPSGKVSNVLEKERNVLEKETLLDNIGKSKGVYITTNDIVILMAVANETGSTIILSNRSGIVGGFEEEPMPTVKVSSGVSVKIPVVIPRIDCLDENGDIVDIANELISHTALKWESEAVDDDKNDSIHKGKRQGRVRIPSRCLKEMIQEHPSFATRICKPPINIRFLVGKDKKEEMLATPGIPLELSISTTAQDWLPTKTIQKFTATLEFCCARKNSGVNSQSFLEHNQGAYIWCGQVRKSFRFDKSDLHHNARLCFTSTGDFVVSACVKIKRGNNEEVWWAPSFQSIKVTKP